MNKKIIIPGLAIAALGVGLVLTGSASAHGMIGDGDFSSRLAQRFNLSEDEVSGFMGEIHEEHRAEHEGLMEERLDQAITGGKLTEEQKSAWLAKHEEIQVRMEELKDASVEERHEAMRGLHEEMQAWAEEQGIEMPMFRMKMGRHMGIGGRRGFEKFAE